MNKAEELLRRMFSFDDNISSPDLFNAAVGQARNSCGWYHRNVQFALFGPSGRKEVLNGREPF